MFTLHYDDFKSIYGILPKEYDIVYNSKGKYINLPCSFDIESTSIINDNLKVGLMYAWGLGINGKVVIGRTWEDFLNSLKIISDYFKLKSKKIKLIIYVHNLSFEFQFFRKLMKWKKVFAFKERQVIYCLNDLNIEFRCSYLLSNNNLDNLGMNLIKYKVNKLVANLDYSKIRHSNTPLNKKEMQYLINDNLVVMAYIQELIENNDNNICNLPLTSTGFVRKYLKNKCYENPKRYNELIRKLRLNIDNYNLLKRCFQGGFTHANPYNLGKLCNNVDSFDIVSSYPFVLLSEKYPMSEPIPYIFKNENDFFNKIKNDNLFICDIKFYGIKSKNKSDYYISSSKCYLQVDTIIFNGRVESANELGLSLTSIDLKIIINNYDFDYFEIGNVYIFIKDYLPKPIILSILNFYKNKTELKDVEGFEEVYMRSKELLNAIYGACVTDVLRDNFTYDNEWITKKLNDEEKIKEIEKYNLSKSRVLYYPWGCFCTSYARKNLWDIITKIDNISHKDYIYSDTDSIKLMNSFKYEKIINDYNIQTQEKLKNMCKYHNINYNNFVCKNKFGNKKLIGIFEKENKKPYEYFKTLGAKRYMYYDNDLHITISGVNKKCGVDYLKYKYDNDIINIFNNFSDNLLFPSEYLNEKENKIKKGCGKLTHYYIDDEITLNVVDYLGNNKIENIKSSVALESTSYDLTITQQIKDYVLNIE